MIANADNTIGERKRLPARAARLLVHSTSVWQMFLALSTAALRAGQHRHFWRKGAKEAKARRSNSKGHCLCAFAVIGAFALREAIRIRRKRIAENTNIP